MSSKYTAALSHTRKLKKRGANKTAKFNNNIKNSKKLKHPRSNKSVDHRVDGFTSVVSTDDCSSQPTPNESHQVTGQRPLGIGDYSHITTDPESIRMLLIDVTVQGITQKCLVDTGCTHSIISKEFFYLIHDKQRPQLVDLGLGQYLTQADGSHVTLLGRALVKILMRKSYLFPWNAVISKMQFKK